MRCAHCKKTEIGNPPVPVTIDHVRSCAGIAVSQAVKFNDDQKTHAPFWPPSDAQVNYVLGLQTERDVPTEYVPKTDDQLRRMEKDEVSRLIGELKVLPYKNPKGRGQSKTEVPEGRYAIYEAGVDDNAANYSYVDRQDLVPPSKGQWTFWQVDAGKGRWAGYTFIVMLVGAPGQYRKVKVNRERRNEILERIGVDPKQAMLDYGLQSGVCGRCSSPLSDPQSLARGIGPVCAGKLGW